MKTLLKISNDYFSTCAENEYNDNLNYLVNELNVYCETSNSDYINIVDDQQKYTTDEKYNNCIEISAKGYSQSEWQDFKLWYNETEIKTKQDKANLKDLQSELKKYFTHKHDYFCQKFEYIDKDGKMFTNNEAFDMTSFAITYMEFPDVDEVKKAYIDIYGEDFDKIEISID